jgi:hypothetical protein
MSEFQYLFSSQIIYLISALIPSHLILGSTIHNEIPYKILKGMSHPNFLDTDLRRQQPFNQSSRLQLWH